MTHTHTSMSAAFDTVDHLILLQRLQSTFGIYDTFHQWFRSYLADRRQCVRRGNITSSTTTLICGVPQGSVLGPVLFVLYTVDLIRLIESHGLVPHLYADDTQVYGSCPPSAVSTLSTTISVLTSTSCTPHCLSFRGIQLKPIWTRPADDVVDALRDRRRERADSRRRTRSLGVLYVVCTVTVNMVEVIVVSDIQTENKNL